MNSSYFFWGVVDEKDSDETWAVLHAHFEKLASQDDARETETVITKRKAAKAK